MGTGVLNKNLPRKDIQSLSARSVQNLPYRYGKLKSLSSREISDDITAQFVYREPSPKFQQSPAELKVFYQAGLLLFFEVCWQCNVLYRRALHQNVFL